jgi:WD40 repeat protein
MVVHRKAAAVGMYKDNILNIWRLRVEPPLVRLVTGYSENVRPFGTGFRAIQWGPASNGLALNVWDATAEGAPRKMTLTQRLDATGVTDAHADPAGRRVVAGAVSGSIRGFEVSAEGRLKEIWGLPSSEIKTQRNGRILIHPARDTVWVRGAVLDFSTGRLLSITDPSEYHGVVSRDGCAWVGEDGLVEIAEKWNESAQERTRVLLRWETSGGKLLAKVHAESALCLCVSPDARWIAEAGTDRKIRIRDAETLRIHTEFRGHDAEITGIQWHPSLPFLVTSARDFTSRIWEIGSFKMLKEYRSEQSGKSYVEISADGKQLWLINDRGADVYEPKFFAR